MNPFVPIHQHLLIKATVTTTPTDPVEGKKLLTDLVKLIDMVPVTDPSAAYVSAAGNEGLTGSINLATSHIAFHVWDTTGLLMLDVYSCTEFDLGKVFKYLETFFGGLKDLQYVVIDRETLTITISGRRKDFDHVQ